MCIIVSISTMMYVMVMFFISVFSYPPDETGVAHDGDVVQLALFHGGCHPALVVLQTVHVALHHPNVAVTFHQARLCSGNSMSHIAEAFFVPVDSLFQNVDGLPLKPDFAAGTHPVPVVAEGFQGFRLFMPQSVQAVKNFLFLPALGRQSDLFRFAVVFPKFQYSAESLYTLRHAQISSRTKSD
jgi:hypothetical protein